MLDNRPKRREVMSLAHTQLKLVALVCIPLVVACMAVSCLETYFFLSTMRSVGVLRGELAGEVVNIAVWITLGVLLLLLSACFMVSVMVGHRIVGPMRRIAARFKAASRGELRTGFTMRDGDEFLFLGESIAEMEQFLTDRVVRLRRAAESLDVAVARLGEAAGPGSEDIVEQVRSAVGSISEELARFDLGDEKEAQTAEPVAETASA